jgi:hypothetical protein
MLIFSSVVNKKLIAPVALHTVCIGFHSENPGPTIVLHSHEKRSVLLCDSRTLLRQHLTKLMQCVTYTLTVAYWRHVQHAAAVKLVARYRRFIELQAAFNLFTRYQASLRAAGGQFQHLI